MFCLLYTLGIKQNNNVTHYYKKSIHTSTRSVSIEHCVCLVSVFLVNIKKPSQSRHSSRRTKNNIHVCPPKNENWLNDMCYFSSTSILLDFQLIVYMVVLYIDKLNLLWHNFDTLIGNKMLIWLSHVFVACHIHKMMEWVYK